MYIKQKLFGTGEANVQILFNFGNRVINICWSIFFALTLYYAWTSPNIILGDNSTFGTSTTLLTTGLIIAVIVIIVAITSYPHVTRLWRWVFVQHQLVTASIMILLVVIGQIVFVSYVHPVSGFDAGMLHYAAVNSIHVKEPGVVACFSMNTNNLPITLLMRYIVIHTGYSSWAFFDFITLSLVDLSAIFNLCSVVLVNRRRLGAAMYLHCGWLLLFPSIIMPYTDAWVLPLVSLIFLSYFVLVHQPWPITIRSIGALGLGCSTAATYFMKPSAIIPLISITIIEVLYWLAQAHHWTPRGIITTTAAVIIIGAGGLTTYGATNRAIENQTYIQLQNWRSIPAIHFMSMGIYGNGGYSEKQAEEMAILQTKKAKTDYSKRLLFARLKKLGVVGYFQFLIRKQGNNTADGTFGWLKEGHFFRENQKPSRRGLSNILKNFIYLYGRNIADFRFAAQAWWIFLLTLIALGWGPRRKIIQILRLTLIGGFLFLLLFEGGRSRYLIQYLPCILLLAVLSIDNAQTNLKHLGGWFNNRRDPTQQP